MRARMKDTAERMRAKRIEMSALNVMRQPPLASSGKAPRKRKAAKRPGAPRGASASSSAEESEPLSEGALEEAIEAARWNVTSNPFLGAAAAPSTAHHTEMGLLRQRLFRAENEIHEREHSCRVCGAVFLSSAENAADRVS